MTRSSSESDLLQRLVASDPDAWVEYTQVYGARVYSYLRKMLPNEEDAEDILSETLLAAVRALPNFDGQASLLTFTSSLARRKVADFWRKNARWKLDELDESSQMVGLNAKSFLFEDALGRLPLPSREALLLRYQVGLSVQEVADVMNRSYKAVESLLTRAREQFRDALDEVGWEDDQETD
jgi:RNA polymerase sigma-70 factor (ECF subfamily)